MVDVANRSAAAPTSAVVVAIDGPAGAGKSTVARAVARAVGFTLVDTGAIYRALALQAMRQNVAAEDEMALTKLADALTLRFVVNETPGAPDQVLLADEDVTQAIRTPEVSDMAARVSTRPLVRRSLVALQRRLAGEGNAVLEGRDIGTVIYPDAPLKFFLDASLDERARRRHEELAGRGTERSLEEVTRDIARRDGFDAQRAVAPLRAAADAIRLDSTTMDAEAVVATIVAAVRAHVARVASAHKPATPNLRQLFADVLPERLSAYAAQVGDIGGTYTFVATGPGGGSWSLDLNVRPPALEAGGDENAACRVTATSQDLLDMLQGRLHPQKAFMQGQLVVQGDVVLALRLGALLA